MPLSPSRTGLRARLAAVCRKHPVTLAYLFGSHARGTADAESDIDVAVVAQPSLSRGDRQRLRFRLLRACDDALPLPHARIDIVVLQDVPILLQYNVVRSGRVLFAETENVRRAFEVEVERRYEDEQPLLDQEAALTVDRILAHAA